MLPTCLSVHLFSGLFFHEAVFDQHVLMLTEIEQVASVLCDMFDCSSMVSIVVMCVCPTRWSGSVSCLAISFTCVSPNTYCIGVLCEFCCLLCLFLCSVGLVFVL